MVSLSKKWYIQWGVALLIFSACIGVYMGKSLTQCTEIYYGAPSDATGGIAWFQWADGNDPIWDSTTKSNYPIGESLRRPQFVTSYLQFFPYWLFSVLTNQFCSINIMIFLGFLSTALAMFGLVRWLLKSYPIALFAGYAAAFVPYHVLKAASHIAYVYSVFFILMIWASIAFYKKPSYKMAIAVAAIYGLSLYFDGYFILISSVLLITLAGLILLRYLLKLSSSKGRLNIAVTFDSFGIYVKRHIKYYLAALVTLILLLAPLAYVAVKKGSQIQAGLNSARSQIEQEANIYGARLSDYLLPSPVHPLLFGEYSEWRIHNIHNSNITENTLYIGYVIIGLAIFAVVASLTFMRAKAKRFRFTIIASIAIIIVGSLVAAPPHLMIAGINLPMPSSLLIAVSESWRVIARLFLIVHVAWVLLASIGLYLLVRARSPKVKIAIISIAALVLVFEFMPNPYPPNWIPSRDVPKVYFKIKSDDTVRAIAEYPVIDSPSATLPYTFTFQQFHNKPVLNANDSDTPQRYLRQSIAGIADAQTLMVLRGLGINMITTYGINGSSVDGLKPYADPDATDKQLPWKLYSYKIQDGPKSNYALTVRDGFSVKMSPDMTKSALGMKNVGIMSVEPLGSSDPRKNVSVGFYAKSANGGAASLIVEQEGVQLWRGDVHEPQNITFTAKAGVPIRLVSPGYDNNEVLYFSDLQSYE